jgi:hypothetical protein
VDFHQVAAIGGNALSVLSRAFTPLASCCASISGSIVSPSFEEVWPAVGLRLFMNPLFINTLTSSTARLWLPASAVASFDAVVIAVFTSSRWLRFKDSVPFFSYCS